MSYTAKQDSLQAIVFCPVLLIGDFCEWYELPNGRIECDVKRVTVKQLLSRAIPFILIAVIFALTVFLPRGYKTETEKRVIRIWNVDTFEGGRGSRTSFLKSVAHRIRKRDENVYYLVTSYTLEGALYAYGEGDRPDILSFGIGLSAFAEQCVSIGDSFSGGNLNGKPLAYPWCRGSYYLFSRTDDFSETGSTAISLGGENLPTVAARLEGIEGEAVESVAAYTGFLSGTYRYLLGTQRDVCRFAARGVSVYSRPLTQFCDLYQYICVLSAERYGDCRVFLEELFSSETQERLSEIGMYSLSSDTPPKAAQTVSVFSSADALVRLREAAKTGDGKILEKNLKSI